MEVNLEGCSLVKSNRYLIVLSFQRGLPHPNKTIFTTMIFHGLETLQVIQEKKKSSIDQCSTGCFRKKCCSLDSETNPQKNIVSVPLIHSLKRNMQEDCQCVHDEVLYTSLWIHQLCTLLFIFPNFYIIILPTIIAIQFLDGVGENIVNCVTAYKITLSHQHQS